MSPLKHEDKYTRIGPGQLGDATLMWTQGVGTEVWLDPLEALVMDCLWIEHPRPQTVTDVHRRIVNEGYDRQYTTVASTLHRLEGKGLIGRHGQRVVRNGNPGRGMQVLFQARVSKAVFNARMITRVIQSLSANFPDEFQQVLQVSQDQ